MTADAVIYDLWPAFVESVGTSERSFLFGEFAGSLGTRAVEALNKYESGATAVKKKLKLITPPLSCERAHVLLNELVDAALSVGDAMRDYIEAVKSIGIVDSRPPPP